MRGKIIFQTIAASLFLFLAAGPHGTAAQTIGPDFQRLGSRFEPAFTVISDRSGYIWTGTTHGLTRYDSHGAISYLHDENDTSSLCHNTVNALLCLAKTDGLLVGTNRGLCLYDPAVDRFHRIEACGTRHIRTLLEHNDSLWVGSSSGLMLLTGYEKGFAHAKAEEVIRERHIMCCREVDGDIYFGTYNKIYKWEQGRGIREIPVPLLNRWYSNLVYDIIPSAKIPGTLLLGTEYGLVRFDPATGKTGMELYDIPVRCFMRSKSGDLWAGTDKGIYLFGTDGREQHIIHESGNAASISDNVVSRIHEDPRGNIWVATDHGICMTMQSSFYTFVHLKSITGSNEGLAIRTMCKDREGALWLGGKNGLIRVGPNVTTWFKSDGGSPDRRVSHNKIRSLHADEIGVWIASDGGLDLYEYASRRFRRFTITEPTRRYNSSWMYGISEDNRGRLWISTYEGGVFVVDKRRLLENTAPSYTADLHFSTANPGFPSNITSKIAVNGTLCFVTTDEGTVTIDTETGEIRPVRLPRGVRAQALDSFGDRVFLGTNTGLYIWHEDSIREIPGPRLPIWVVAADKERVWTVSDAIMSAYDIRSGGGIGHHRIGNNPLLSCLIDGEKVYAGTTDGYHVISSEDFSQSNETLRTRITGLNISNHRISVGERVGNDVLLTRNIDITDRLVLPHNRNSFTLEFSDFDFSLTEHRYAYRLKGLNDDWQITENGSNHATFINLPTGSYLFEVGSILSDGRIQEDPATLQIEVRPQWYAGPIAWIVYALLFVVLLAATLSVIRARRQLALEQAERDKALKMVKMKSDFLANLAHEFKTPLSIILGHVGKLISVEADSLYCQELVSMQRNAEKMHRLIDKMVTDNETDNGALFIPSATSIVELTRKVYDEFAPAMAEKGINTRFYCDNIRYIFMLDRVKIESVLSNLLSNAMKFTPAGGNILVSVTVGRETGDLIYADITVEDTGVGIRPEELPHIFNQYYRAASNQDRNSHGSGIGLYLVKSIVEMHKGTVSVDSTPGKGSRFTVRLSTMKADSFIMQDEDRDENVSLYSLSKVWNHERKPIILLVEDNRDIRDFITASLGDDYTFVCAENGKQGLDLLAGNKIDLVITDIVMPVMDGLQMSRRIRRSMATTFLPIIILTGKNGPNVELESYEFADAFISKPFSLKYLNSRIILLLIKHEQYLEKIRQEQMMTAQVEEIRNPDEVFLREITDLINAHIDDPEFSAARLCELSRYSSKQIYRKIKQLNGMGAVEFIREVRLRKAALYLKQNKLTVTEVMYMVGFTTPSYFSKCFKARFGVTPSEYAASEEK